MFGGEVEMRLELIHLRLEALDGLWILRLVVRREGRHQALALLLRRRVHHGVQLALGLGLQVLRQLVEHVGDLVHPAPLLARLGEDVAQRSPESERAIADGDDRRAHAASLHVPEERRPALGRLAEAVLERDDLFRAVRPRR